MTELNAPQPISYDKRPSPKAKIRITVEGIEPLMTHSTAAMSVVSSDAKRGTRIPKPDEEAEAGAYRMEDGTCAIKAESFIGAIAGKSGAAGAWKTKNRGTMKSRLAHIVASEDLVPLFYPDGQPIKEYEIDLRPVIVQKSRVIRARPKYQTWRTRFTIEYDPQLGIDPKMIVDICADAGSRIGVGDYRPRFGRFRVVDYLEL